MSNQSFVHISGCWLTTKKKFESFMLDLQYSRQKFLAGRLYHSFTQPFRIKNHVKLMFCLNLYTLCAF